MVRVELTPLGSFPLVIRVIRIARPLDGVSHAFHDGHDLNGLDIAVILGDASVVYMCGRALTQPCGRPIE